MKTSISLGFALFTIVTAQAQIFRPETINGALLGGVAGAIIGNNSGDLHHNAWKGAAIGVGAGALLSGAMANTSDGRYQQYGASGGAYVYRNSPVVYAGYNRNYRRGRGYYGGFYGYGPTYGYVGSGSYAADGFWLGGLAGGIIGNNSGSLRHDAWRGAAWGAGIGWLLGAIADANRPAVAYSQAPVELSPAPVSTPGVQPQPVTIINNYYNAPATPMSSANSLFGRN